MGRSRIILFLIRHHSHFVENITIGAPGIELILTLNLHQFKVIKCVRKHTKAFMDCHIMVSNPEKWVKDFADAGANQYTFHFEATSKYLSSYFFHSIFFLYHASCRMIT